MPNLKEENNIYQTVGKDIQAYGDVTFENVSLIAKQTIIKGEISFDEVSVESFRPENFESPPFATKIKKQIEQQKVIILAGDPRINKYHLAKHIACLIAIDYPDTCVQEFKQNSYAGLNIRSDLQKAQKRTIFILPDVPHSSIRLPIDEITKLVSPFECYIIATTDTSKEIWRSYDKKYLYDVPFEDVEKHRHLVSDLSDEHRMSAWYYEELDPREQLLAIALVLFNGFYGDQFFAALEQLVERVWQRRDSSLRALDYCDLDKLRNFFSFAGKNEKEETVKIASSRQRRLLLKVAWGSHRRQILSAIPILVSLVKGSLNNFSLELYGTEERSARLRRVTAETLSDIGLVSQDWKVVEEHLLSLASSRHIEVQAVAAYALARWRTSANEEGIYGNEDTVEEDADARLFDIIKRWQETAQINSLIESFIENGDHEKSTKPVDYISATVALMVGFASEADACDQMPDHLLERIKLLVADKNMLVQRRILSDTLPRIIRRHTKQIAGELIGFLMNANWKFMVVAISKSLAEAYKFRPDAVMEILQSWQEEAENNRPDKISTLKITQSEVMLATVAMTYGEIDPDNKADFLNNENIFEKLQEILSKELHPEVRKFTLIAVGLQAQKRFGKLAQHLQTLVAVLSKEERENVADILTGIYLQQRRRLSGGDDVIEVKNASGEMEIYSVWLNSQRPLTDVETEMFRWAKDTENSMAQQVAFGAVSNFARRFDIQESLLIEEKKKSLNIVPLDTGDEYASPIETGGPPGDWYLGRLIPWIVARNAEYYRTCIRNLLPATLSQRKKNRAGMNFVLSKWLKSLDNEIKCISKKLKPGIWLAQNLKGAMVTAAIVLVVTTTLVLKQSKVFEEKPPSAPAKSRAIEAVADNGTIVNEHIQVSDPNSSTLDQGILEVRFAGNAKRGDILSIHNQGTGYQKISLAGDEVFYGDQAIGRFSGGKEMKPLIVRFNANTGINAVQTLMRLVIYSNVASPPELGLRSVEFQVTDRNGLSSNIVMQSILVSKENEGPRLTTPDGLAAKEDAPLGINGIQVDGPESTKNITITFVAGKGAINIYNNLHGEATTVNIECNNSSKAVLIGNAKDVNAILSSEGSIIYKGSEDDTLTVTVSDGGMDLPADDDVNVWPPGCQKEKICSTRLPISVEARNKPPTISLASPSVTVNEGEWVWIGGITVEDPDTEELQMHLSVKHGVLALNGSVADAIGSRRITGNNSNSLKFGGINKTVAAELGLPEIVSYTPQSSYRGSDILQIRVDDGGRGGSARSVSG